MKIDLIILNISKSENITENTLKNFIRSFEKYIKSEIKKYDDNSGLEDIKMNKNDYKILHKLYFNTSSSPYKIHILLLYMYSFYKLDGINFSKHYFPLKLFFNFLLNNDKIHSFIFEMIETIK